MSHPERVSHPRATVFLVGDVLKFDLNLTIFLRCLIRARLTKSIFGKVNKEKEVAFRPDSPLVILPTYRFQIW